MIKCFATVFLLVPLAVSLSSPSLVAGSVVVSEKGDAIRLENNYLARTFTVSKGTLHATEFENKLSGRAYRLWGDGFELKLTRELVDYDFGGENPLVLTSNDFEVLGRDIRNLRDGGRQVVFHLVPLRLRAKRPSFSLTSPPHLKIDVVYELRPDDFYGRQWLKLDLTGKGTYFIDYLCVAKNHWDIRHFALGGFGQPLFGNDLFMGLEYPTSFNKALGSEVSLGRYVGVDIPSGGYTTQAAVIGVAGDAVELHDAFMKYVTRIRVGHVRPFLLYESWYDLERPALTDKSLLKRIDQFRGLLVEKYGVHMNSIVLSSGWDNLNRPWTLDPQAFPDGLASITSALVAMNTRLGMWVSPIGGYGHLALRVAALRSEGMEITSNGHLCLAGKKYSRYLRDQLLKFQKEYGVNYFKLDGIPRGCNVPGHGHPLGPYSSEADVRAWIGILEDLRAQDPGVFLNTTTGIWLSPWWLRWADTVWMGGADYAYLSEIPALSLRQSAINYRDAKLYDDFVRHDVQFPTSSIMTGGIIKGQLNLLGGKNESIEDWDDELVHYFSVGNMLYELYITPTLLKPEEWDSVARTIRWAESNVHPLLDNSTMVLGDPGDREPYGFVHYSPPKTFVMLRNPFVRPRTVHLKLDIQAGFEPSDLAFRAEVIYPYRLTLPAEFRYGDTLNFRLNAFEESLIRLEPVSTGKVELMGARYSVDKVSGDEVGLRLYAPAGSTRVVALSSPSNYSSLDVNGVKIHLRTEKNQATFVLHFGSQPNENEPSFTLPSIYVQAAGNRTTAIEGKMTVAIPHDFDNCRLALLLEPEHPTAGIRAEVTDNGRPAPLQADTNRIGKGRWYWYSFPVLSGHHALDFKVQLPVDPPGAIKLSGWLLGKRQLAAQSLRIKLQAGKKLRLPEKDPLPHITGEQKETYVIFSRHFEL